MSIGYILDEGDDRSRDAQITHLKAKLKIMRQLLEQCRKAILSVQDRSVFGIGGDGMTHWYLADELLSEIAAAQQEQEDE